MVSDTYTGVLLGVSFLLVVAVQLLTKLPWLLISALGPFAGFNLAVILVLPMWFTMAAILLLIAPHFVSPRLVLRPARPITTLDLNGGDGE